MDFSYSTPPFLTKNEKFDREKMEKVWKLKGFEVGNMYLRACSLAHMYYTADYTCTTIVHHVTGENFQLFFDFFWLFFDFLNKNGSSLEVLATCNNEITLDIMLPTWLMVPN